MRISLWVHIRRVVEAVALPNRIGEKRRRTSDVRGFVRAGRRHGPRVAVPCRHDQTASPDRLRASRYSFFVDVCIVSLSGKSQSCVSVCNVEMQCLLAKWLILSLVLSFGTSLDRSCICADRIPRFRFKQLCATLLKYLIAGLAPEIRHHPSKITLRSRVARLLLFIFYGLDLFDTQEC